MSIICPGADESRALAGAKPDATLWLERFCQFGFKNGEGCQVATEIDAVCTVKRSPRHARVGGFGFWIGGLTPPYAGCKLVIAKDICKSSISNYC